MVQLLKCVTELGLNTYWLRQFSVHIQESDLSCSMNSYMGKKYFWFFQFRCKMSIFPNIDILQRNWKNQKYFFPMYEFVTHLSSWSNFLPVNHCFPRFYFNFFENLVFPPKIGLFPRFFGVNHGFPRLNTKKSRKKSNFRRKN